MAVLLIFAVNRGVLEMMSKRWLWAIAAPIVLSGCSTKGLQEYQQLTMDVTVPSAEESSTATKGSNALDYLAETEAVIARRLRDFGVADGEVTSQREPEQIIVRLPMDVDVAAAETVLTRRGQLYLRNEKPETEVNLSAAIETLQRLLVEQNTLLQTEKTAEAEALTAEIEQTRTKISDFFEPSELTGDRLKSAKAVQEEGDVWAVLIQFDEQGSKMFAQQTKEMAGTGRVIGLFLDNVLLSKPAVDVSFVETGITGGEALIAGNFTEAGAKDLEIQLNSGALPVYLKTVDVVSSAEIREEEDNSLEGTDKSADTEENANPEDEENKSTR